MEYGSLTTASSLEAPSVSSCDAWGARITTTLLIDLSEEERKDLAEHTKTCSACAKRLRSYQIIEEFPKELLKYPLVARPLKYKPIPAMYQAHIPRRKRKRGKIITALLLSLVFVFFLIPERTGGVLFVEIGSGMLLLLFTVVCSMHQKREGGQWNAQEEERADPFDHRY